MPSTQRVPMIGLLVAHLAAAVGLAWVALPLDWPNPVELAFEAVLMGQSALIGIFVAYGSVRIWLRLLVATTCLILLSGLRTLAWWHFVEVNGYSYDHWFTLKMILAPLLDHLMPILCIGLVPLVLPRWRGTIRQAPFPEQPTEHSSFQFEIRHWFAVTALLSVLLLHAQMMRSFTPPPDSLIPVLVGATGFGVFYAVVAIASVFAALRYPSPIWKVVSVTLLAVGLGLLSTYYTTWGLNLVYVWPLKMAVYVAVVLWTLLMLRKFGYRIDVSGARN